MKSDYTNISMLNIKLPKKKRFIWVIVIIVILIMWYIFT